MEAPGDQKEDYFDFNPTPEQSPLKMGVEIEEMHSERNRNTDFFIGDYNTQHVVGKKQLVRRDEDGLPTIFEKSGAEPIGHPNFELDISKVRSNLN